MKPGKREAQNYSVLIALRLGQKVLIVCPSEAATKRWVEQWKRWAHDRYETAMWPNLDVETIGESKNKAR